MKISYKFGPEDRINLVRTRTPITEELKRKNRRLFLVGLLLIAAFMVVSTYQTRHFEIALATACLLGVFLVASALSADSPRRKSILRKYLMTTRNGMRESIVTLEILESGMSITDDLHFSKIFFGAIEKIEHTEEQSIIHTSPTAFLSVPIKNIIEGSPKEFFDLLAHNCRQANAQK
jgi:hypothetical protein